MISPRLAAELVVQTATALLVGGLGPREALTILATQVPQAMSNAASLVQEDADRAATYAALLRSLAADLGRQLESSNERRDLRAVIGDIDRVAAALGG